MKYLKSSKKVKFKKVIFVVRLLCVFFIILGLSSALYWFIYKSEFFDITLVNIRGKNVFVSINDMQNMCNSRLIGKNILFVNTSKTSLDLVNSFLASKSIKIQKRLPKTIIIEIEEREPMAILQKPDSDDLYLIDKEGFVLGLSSESFSALPKAYYEDDIKIGNFINKDIAPVYLEIVETSKKENLNATSMSINGKYTRMFFNDVEVKLSNGKNIPESLKVISALIKDYALRGKPLKSIDLRFDKVIVL